MTMAPKRKIEQKENIPPKQEDEPVSNYERKFQLNPSANLTSNACSFAIQQKPSVSANPKNNNQLDDGNKKRLDYLLKQAEVFSHFVTNGTESTKDAINEKRNALAAANDDSSSKK